MPNAPFRKGEQVYHCKHIDQCGEGLKYNHVACFGDKCRDYKKKEKKK